MNHPIRDQGVLEKFFPDFRQAQEGLLAEYLSKNFTKSIPNRFALLHFYWGNHEERGSVRLSRLCIPDDSPLRSLATIENDKCHTEAFRYHISVFGSQWTLLKWIYFAFLRRVTTSQTQESSQHQDHFSVRFEFDELETILELTKDDHPYDALIRIDKSIIESLWPQHLYDVYAKQIYSQNVDDDSNERFIIHRGKALGALSQSQRKLAAHLGSTFIGITSTDSDQSALQFFAALQSAIIYLSMTKYNTKEVISSIDFHCHLGKDFMGAAGESPPIVILFTLDCEKLDTDDIDSIYKQLELCNEGVTANTDKLSSLLPNAGHFIGDLADPRINRILNGRSVRRENWLHGMDVLKSYYHFSRFQKWRECLVAWLTTLVCEMHDKIHEGDGLGFWFVCGDLSEVLDSDKFVLERTLQDDLKTLSVPWYRPKDGSQQSDIMIETEYDEHIAPYVNKDREIAIRAASSENYTWFNDARYALFWDITFPDPRPVGLLRLVDSNWDWFTRAMKESPQSIRSPKLVIAYKRPEGSGGVLVGPEPIVSLLDDITRTHNVERWIKELSGRYTNGETLVGEMELLSKILVRIADNPRTGCCVVFLEDSPRTKFIKMGYEWGLEEPIIITEEKKEDILNLMPMDGATCVWYNDDQNRWDIDFRYLLHGDPSKTHMIRQAIEKQVDCPLRGTGSRRWSGAVAAYLPGVRMVIVVSQDGDMYAFRRTGQDILELSVSYKPDKNRRNKGTFKDWEPVFR